MARTPLDPYALREDIISHLGHVFTSTELRDHAAAANIAFATITRTLRTTAHRIDLARPNTTVWHFTPWDREFSAEHAFARAAVLTAGTWPVVAGAWALLLDGLVTQDTPALAYGIRFVSVERVTCAPARAASSATERDQCARMLGVLPPAVVGRRVMTIGERVAAHVTTRRDHLGDVDHLTSPGIGTVHRQERHRAVIEMFSNVRLSGGFNAIRDTLAHCLDELDPVQLGRAARRAPLAARRRLADALYELGFEHFRRARIDGVGRPWPWPYDRPDMQRWLELRLSRGLTLLDPHREACGEALSRHGTRDNRSAPLRPAKVLTEPIVAELEPECWHALEHPDPAGARLDLDMLDRYGTRGPR